MLFVEPQRPVGEEEYRTYETKDIKVHIKNGLNIKDDGLIITLSKLLWFKKIMVEGIDFLTS
ncbi:MAG TPA: hypothetical protein DEF34_00550 [Desulfotomaculum sp.]|nr:MAG: hypothetical protein VR67_08065 [Peptococcaceae bacterium BRH_c8a]HBX22116.1 hypothetical protein [Desulfotomaculum sp.]